MNLFAERNSRIDSENAFKVGPHIVRVEQQNGEVTKIQLDDFSILRFYVYNMRTYFEGIFCINTGITFCE